jgi:uncharacterized protein YggE
MKSRKSLAATLAVLLAAMPVAAAPALAQEPASRPLPVIRVTGEGTARLAPDLAIVTLGVVRQAPTAREALDAHTKVTGELGEAMRGFGLEPKDLQTANFSIQPQYVYPAPKATGEQDPPSIVGYQVSSQMVVRLRDITKIGNVLDQAVTLGVNSDGGIQFTNDDPAQAISQARIDAMKDALARATTLAQAAGVTLGAVSEITENSYHPQPMPITRGKMMLDSASASPVPVEAGENAYSVTVQAVFEIKQ